MQFSQRSTTDAAYVRNVLILWGILVAGYLVTGGAGFIGSHLCDALVAAGHYVKVFDNLSTGTRANLPQQASLIEGDIRDADALSAAMKGADGCFHLAAIASVDKSNSEWVATHQTNLTGTINVFEAAREAGRIPVIYASSAAVYGAEPVPPIEENAPKRPLSAYGADKFGCELHALPAWHVHGVPSLGLRLFNVYGPRQDPKSPYSGVISIFVSRLKAGADITIHGDGSQTRDFIYVSDVCDAFMASMISTNKGAAAVNVCTGMETSILELAEILADLTGYTKPFAFGPPRPGDIPKSYGNNSLMTETLGVTPGVPLKDGLARTIAEV